MMCDHNYVAQYWLLVPSTENIIFAEVLVQTSQTKDGKIRIHIIFLATITYTINIHGHPQEITNHHPMLKMWFLLNRELFQNWFFFHASMRCYYRNSPWRCRLIWLRLLWSITARVRSSLWHHIDITMRRTGTIVASIIAVFQCSFQFGYFVPVQSLLLKLWLLFKFVLQCCFQSSW